MDSVCAMFKIGIGPSSSHTVGPMNAGIQFLEKLAADSKLGCTTRIQVDIYGSLSATGKGHHTDKAVIMGLAGYKPETVDIAMINPFIAEVERTGKLKLAQGQFEVDFPADNGLVFHDYALPLHENGLTFHAFDHEQEILQETYYSTGGGFIVTAQDFGKSKPAGRTLPYPFKTAQDLLDLCDQTGLSISALVLENENAIRDIKETEDYFDKIWITMKSCMERGMMKEGVLPGPLQVPRRAAILNRTLLSSGKQNKDPMRILDWINMMAFAVSEENAAGGRVVTAPTNGACGIIPSVLAYYNRFVELIKKDEALRFFLTSGTIGLLYKMNASISGAEVGCQGEVGVACSMAAAGLAELMGGSPQQVCIAAEIGMEHNLGLTCDPVAGQVQVPCIERNAIAAVKAVNAARMSMLRRSAPRVSLDEVIATMYETGKDMSIKYRETSSGGLAAKVCCDPCYGCISLCD